jgi:hypothetical protein
MITKSFCAYTMNSLRQEKGLRDNGARVNTGDGDVRAIAVRVAKPGGESGIGA